MPTTNPTAAEALGDKIPFTYDGTAYLLDPTSEWPFEALEVLEEGKVATFLKLVLGAEQYAAFRKHKYKVGRVNAFVEELQNALGVEGN